MTDAPRSRTPEVLLATAPLVPAGESGGQLLVDALAARDVHAAWAVWDDEDVDWAGARLVAVRSTWDYHRRLDEFLSWARRTAATTPVLNGADVFAWNADKAYLAELAGAVDPAELPVVPTRVLDDRTLVAGLQGALADWGRVVVKPATGAGGVGVVVVESVDDEALADLVAGPWVVQPLVESVRTTGEVSVFVLDGRPVAQVDKVPAAGEIRVHEHLGGTYRASAEVGLDAGSPGRVALAAVAAVEARHGARPAYARVDLLHHEGRWTLSELELIEPALYLDLLPGVADRFAALVAARLGR